MQAYGYICFISEYTIVMFDSKTREKRYVLKMSDVNYHGNIPFNKENEICYSIYKPQLRNELLCDIDSH